MVAIDKIRSELVNKILTINNEAFLLALDQLIDAGIADSHVVKTTSEQKIMLEMSEADIINGRMVSQEAMDKRNMEWLNEM